MRVSLSAPLVGLLVPLCLSGLARGAEPSLPPAELDGVSPTREGLPGQGGGTRAPYSGVAPGSNVRPPFAPKRKNPARVTWTGFQPLEQGAGRVFVEMTEEVPYQVAETPTGLRIELRNVRLHVRNHRLPLETEHFATPVSRVAVREKGRTVTIDISTRGKVTHTAQVETHGGYRFLMVDMTGASASAETGAGDAGGGIAGAPSTVTKP